MIFAGILSCKMTSQELMNSGIIELYCLGIASDLEHKIVEDMMEKDSHVRFEIEAINKALNLYASQLIEEKSLSIKKKILDHISAEDDGAAPLLTRNSGADEWLKYIDDQKIQRPTTAQGLTTFDLPGNENRTTFILWGNKGDVLPDEEHEGVVELVLVLSGSCKMTIDGKQISFSKGDCFSILPNILHSGIITSEEEMLVVVQRRAA